MSIHTVQKSELTFASFKVRVTRARTERDVDRINGQRESAFALGALTEMESVEVRRLLNAHHAQLMDVAR